jgi:aspartyl-tRNA(Asn)/glutamyl-tRNA(Gln) amidotransferase subunit A
VSDELLSLTAAEQARRIESGEVSAAEAFDYWRGRAASDDLGAYLWVADEAPGDAGSFPPIAVKDLFCVKGVPSMAGSRILEGYRPPYTATSVENLQNAGIQVLGKTNQDEFAMGSSNENSGFGPVQNPWDRTRVPGGSSGGSAAAVAAGTAPWAIGTDTGGSIRQPASLCGIVGMKPTYGAVSRYGMIAFASSLDQCGPLTRDVTDAAILLSHLQGRDPCDSTSLGIEGGVALPTAERLDGLRFGIWGMEEPGLEPGVAEQVRATLAKIEELGGSVEPIELPNAGHGIAAYYVIAPAEASANLARYDGVRYGPRAAANGDLTALYEETRHDAYYGTAQKVRTRIAQDFAAAFEKVDFVVSPTSATVAFKLGERTQDPLAMYLSDYYTVPMPLAGIPAISIPCGLSEGLPVGFQIAGPAFSEARILDAAHALEKEIAFDGVPVR